MKDINNKIPTIEELKEKVKKDNIELSDDFELDELLVKESLKIVNNISGFRKFLQKNNYENYELPTFIFEEIAYYIDDCFKKGKIDDIKEILKYLDNLILEGNDEVINTISVGFLEFLSRSYKEILQKTVDIMPKNLKELFKEWYSCYLKDEED